MKSLDLFDTTAAFAVRLDSALAKHGMLEASRTLQMDHICVRLGVSHDVEQLRRQLIQKGTLISEAMVSKRVIYIIQLTKPLQVGSWFTKGIELPHPKSGHNYVDGWQHVEFVLPNTSSTRGSVLDSFHKCFPGFDQDFDVSEPKVDSDQLPNPSINVNLDGVGIKFHASSIQEVVGRTQLV